MNVIRWLDMRLKVTYKPLLGLIFDRKLKNHNEFKSLSLPLHFLTHLDDPITVTTLILNEYRQSSNSSVLAFKFNVQRQLRMPIAKYCLSVELVRVRSEVDS
jgi:hypothetical protein